MSKTEIGVKEEKEKHGKKIGTVIQSGDSFCLWFYLPKIKNGFCPFLQLVNFYLFCLFFGQSQGHNPPFSTEAMMVLGCSTAVEHMLRNSEVTGSNPVKCLTFCFSLYLFLLSFNRRFIE